jgi:hypothetical protein
MSNLNPFFLSIGMLVGIWLVVSMVISQIGGWALLAQQYRCLEPFPETRWSFQRAQFRWGTAYNNCLTFGADPHGLYLAVFPLFRLGHPPLFIPWREISVSRRKTLWIKQVRLQLGLERQIPVTIRENLAQKLQNAAGSSWPVESSPAA